MDKTNANKVFDLLLLQNKNPKGELNFSNPLECLVAVLLSAQCTDKRVNLATEKLFQNFKTAQDYAQCDVEVLKTYIKSVNFYPTKAKNLIALGKKLCADFSGQVPSDIEKLTTLPGVGRKTAQVVLSQAFSIPAVPVDTHVFRVCNRTGISNAKTVEETEKDIREKFDEDKFINLHNLLVLHGRYVCKAKKPDCELCVLKNICEKRI